MDYKIEKIEKNNVEVTPRKKIKSTNGVEFEIFDEDNIESYGHDRIDEELKVFKKELANAKNFDCKAYKQKLINKAQKEYDKIIDVKTVMGN